MKKFSFLFIWLCVASLIFAEKMELSIRYLGLPVVKVLITDLDSRITVQADATRIASIAASMNNDYISLYSENYLPQIYRKIIDQKDYQEDRLINYDRSKLLAHRISYLDSDKNLDYAIKPESRDFFSSLFYLRKACDQKK
ncbi:MAG TPA: hypothetical protein PLD62_05390, partial [Candidatus Cloacimonadota bacterium]|nr:hypothetical protein [Candidatus Cloacimonadota bacterium]